MIAKTNNTISFLKNLFIEIFFNKTDKVSDISDNSVVNATAFGIAKIAQKALKDVAITEAKIFPDTATGEFLDEAAKLFGVSPRRNSGLPSTTYVRVYCNSGTIYPATGDNAVSFINTDGIVFNLEQDYIIESESFETEEGEVIFPPTYAYLKVRSSASGAYTNVAPNTINSITPVPSGHIACTNEYYAIGGEDVESDEAFRKRIQNNLNILSIGTREYLTQVFQSLNPSILKVINVGLGENGMYYITLVTQNGSELTPDELNTLLDGARDYFPITDLNVQGNIVGIELRNVDWYLVGENDNEDKGIDFRIDIDSNFNIDEVRKNIQIAMTKYLDFRYWKQGQKIIWDDLLEIVKNTSGVKSVPSVYFYPQKDETVPLFKLPRIRKFIMRDLNGNIIYSQETTLPEVFYSK